MFRIGTAALENMTLSNSLTNLGTLFGMAREANEVDLDKITFLQVPVYDLEGEFAGRVAVIPDRAELLFDKIANDEPLIIEEANVGTGAVVAEDQGDSGQVDSESTDAEPKTQPEGAQSSEGASVSSASEPLPSWVQGTNASVKSCSS